MLAVAVDLDRDVVVVAQRVLVARLDRAADSQVVGVADDDRALGLGLGGGRVVGAVVDDQDVEPRRLAVDVAHDPADHPRLVVGGHDRELRKVI